MAYVRRARPPPQFIAREQTGSVYCAAAAADAAAAAELCDHVSCRATRRSISIPIWVLTIVCVWNIRFCGSMLWRTNERRRVGAGEPFEGAINNG